MPENSVDRFLQIIRKSQLVAETDLVSLLSELDALPASGRPQTPEALAERLIEKRLLNRWQTDNLLKGKYRGFTLGKYTLLDHLGTGGMSAVYLAKHPVMERLVAIKVLPKRYVTNQNYLDRFRREARAVAQLDHPNIVRAHDIDQDGDTHYIVMEHVDGRDLQAIVRADGPLDPFVAADYIAQAALGLQHAHEAGLIHRDVKPANCLVDRRGVVKLLDMGLAKFSEDDRPALSAIYDDSVVGTADYLAPEQAINSQTVDSRADIYSLGCTLYFCLTGRPPFPEGSIASRLMKHQTEEPTSIYELRKDVPPFLVDICRRMMIKSRDHRIQSAALVAEELTSWLARSGRVSQYLRTHSSTASTASGGSGVTLARQRGGGSTTVVPPPHPVAPSPPGRPLPGETVPTSKGDTRRIPVPEPSVNDDLMLAPIEEEKPAVPKIEPPKSTSGISAAAAKSAVVTKEEIKAYESGPLDALMRDASFSKSAVLPRKQLTTIKKEKKISAPMVMLITVLSLFGLATLILIGAIIYASLISPVH